MGLGSASTANFVSHELQSTEAAHARAIIEAVPIGASVAAVMDVGGGSSTWHALRGEPVTDKVFWAHFPAYLIVRRDAEIPWMFGREHGHLPVRHPNRGELGFPMGEYSWARKFLPEEAYAHQYRHVLVRTTESDPNYDPKQSVFGERSAQAVALAHHGRFWLYEFTPTR